MIILGIETSCDETAVSLIEISGTPNKDVAVKVLADITYSQIELHKQYGGVFPMMAKREHSRNLMPIFRRIIEEGFEISNSQFSISNQFSDQQITNLKQILEREPDLLEQFLKFIPTVKKPPIDAIAVTRGPGLEPTLWVGINFAKALSAAWNIPIIPVNHMEGHIFSALLAPTSSKPEEPDSKSVRNLKAKSCQLSAINFPAVALLISGGHTELILLKEFGQYQIIGQTRDDAVGEAFDKVARILGLPYPGGPQISALAEKARSLGLKAKCSLPRPMLHSNDFDFSFSGLKTAVLYLVKDRVVNEVEKQEIALEFENAATEVLTTKTRNAIEAHAAKTLIVGGGVVANTHIRKSLSELSDELHIPLFLPDRGLSTDNALMIAIAGYFQKESADEVLVAKGNLRLG